MTIGGHFNTHREETVAAGHLSVPRDGKFVDIHCHCLPGLDDGPQSVEESLALCRMLMEDNIGLVVATPHQLGRFETRTSTEQIHKGVQRLNHELRRCGLDLTVLPGAEVWLDERICALLAYGGILTLADTGRYILLELPWDVFIDIEPLLHAFEERDMAVILAHPERNLPLLGHLDTLRRWQACGVSLQLTAASVVGAFGRQIEETAWHLLTRGSVRAVATDAHDVDANRPYMTRAFTRIAEKSGRDLARLLCIENPSRIAAGQKLIPVGSHCGEEAR